MAEEVALRTGHMLGNDPQAFSHIVLVTAAYANRAPAAVTAPPSQHRGAGGELR